MLRQLHWLLLCVATSLATFVHAQNIGINMNGAAPAASSLLDIDATALPAADKRGLLIPRIALTSRIVAAPVVAPATSLVIYNTATAGATPNNVIPGFYYWNGATEWLRMFSGNDAWSTTGNSGTTAGTNFIGTIDAKDFVVKTGGSAAGNERMRVLSAGNTVLNNAGIYNTDVFSVYGNNTTNGATNSISNTLGTDAISGYASGTGVGVGGYTSGSAFGVAGVATATTGTPIGVVGESASLNGIGVLGAANTSLSVIPNATNAVGIQGEVDGTLAATGTAFGVLGILTMTTGDARGVQGQTAADNGTGVLGFATSTAVGTQPEGVYGAANNATGFGMNAGNGNNSGTALIATGNNAAGTYLVGGSGAAFNGSTIGGFGYGRTVATGSGLVGAGNNGGILTPTKGCGVAGTGKQYGVVGFATTTVNTNPNSNSAANGNNASAGGYFEVQNGGTAQTWAYVGVRDNTGVLRKIIGPGTVNTIVKDLNGDRVALSCPEAPENLFQDYGSGQLVNGKAHIELDPVLAKNIIVDEQHPLRIFVQLEGDCKGVFVSNKTGSGFDVTERESGNSNVYFSYSVVANRADEVLPDGSVSRYSEERFTPAPGPIESVVQETGKAERRPPVAIQPTSLRSQKIQEKP